MMKNRYNVILALFAFALVGNVASNAQASQDSIIRALKTIDPEILQYFPRWRICEPDLQVQIKQNFALMGYNPADLDAQNIIVTCAPLKEGAGEPEYDLILVECGSERMVAAEIAANMKKLSFRISDPKRPYCYVDIPPAAPPSAQQTATIISYMEPTNVQHAFTLSLFEQALKIGNSGFWLKSSIGTDQVGYQYWSSGEGRVYLQRPLYVNEDKETKRAIPYLMNIRLGAGYRVTGGLDSGKKLLEFVPGRKLNAGAGGKIVTGIDFHMPFKPQAGLAVNLELPMAGISADRGIDPTTYFLNDIGTRRITAPSYAVDPYATAYLLRGTGQVTLFYNWWVDPARPENFFRFDVGMTYAEVREAAVFKDTTVGFTYLANAGVNGLQTYKNNEFGDWIYAKAEYRNQATFPFGVSLQYSNQMLLGRVYLPVLGDWLYIEGRYSTPLRGVRPFEIPNFFMVSPVLRLNF